MMNERKTEQLSDSVLCTAVEAANAACRAAAAQPESLFEITNRVLLTAEQPSVYFYALKDRGCLDLCYPEVGDMAGVPQNPVYHPEGDVFVHTMLVLDRAAELRPAARMPLAFMYAALLHDAGKCEATQIQENGKITAYGHEVLGDERIRRQMERLTGDRQLIDVVLNHAQLHMRPNMLYGAKSRKKKTRAMFDLSMCPEDLILLSRADASGKLDAPYDMNAEVWLRERLEDYRARAALPMVTEDDLTALGIADPQTRAELLIRARQLHFSGLNRSRALHFIMKENMQK